MIPGSVYGAVLLSVIDFFLSFVVISFIGFILALFRTSIRAGNIVSAGVESTIIVVSDGEDTCGGNPCAAARAVKAKRPNITINVIDLGRGEGQAMMHCIADVTGGNVLTPNSTLDMKNKVQQATRLPDTRNCR